MPEEIPVTETVEAEVEATIEAEVEAPDEEDKTDEAQEQKITPYPCIDYRTLPDSVLSDPPSVLNVTSQQLNDILQDESVANRCAIVYFYASWSYYSCEYAYQYNALGRAFNSLPILAVDLHYNDISSPEYVVLYYPSMSLFFNGTIAKRFDPSKSFEELKTLVTNVTGLEPISNVTLSDVDKEGPLLTKPVPVENWLLQFCWWYVSIVGVVCCIYYLSPINYIRTLWSRPKTD
ncbi:thioredoxin domain-containing protein 15-like [Dysidea avara]|uniref:thioredoxin domain-containing protein 15-like n=1 Tax=Dysidea avara TaxID=196820 RepID=UPI003329E88D